MKRWILVCLAALMWCQLVEAKVKLAPIFASHMVLQREMRVPVWGTADAGEKVKVSFGGQVLETTAGQDGKWRVDLAPMKANAKPQTLTVNDVVFEDVLVGEVWICSGQSNMEMPMWSDKARWRNIDGDKICAQGANPLIRTGRVVRKWATQPQTEFSSVWMALDAENGLSFSAVAFFFGQELQAKLGIPIGLVRSCWSGTRIEPWIPPCGFDSVSELKGIAAEVNAKLPGHPAYKAAAAKTAQDYAQWLADFQKAAEEGRELQPPPAFPAELTPYSMTPRPHQQPTTLYNAMIHPMVPFAARGFIWYQGCSNRGEGMLYRYKMQALLNGWRKVFENPEMRLYFVQLAPYRYGGNPEALPEMWEAQSAFEKANEPLVGMAVINDVGDYGDIHPHNKGPVGKRLAAFALARDYGIKGIEPDFPRPVKFQAEKGAIVVSFEHVKRWDYRGEGPLAGFQVAGIDGAFQPAQVQMRGTDIVVSSPEVPRPRAVRYLWHQTVTGKLFNENGLPLTAFRLAEPFQPEAMVTELTGEKWQLAFDFDLFKGVPGNRAAAYDVDNSAKLKGQVKRVAYLFTGTRSNGTDAWLFVAMDAFTPEAAKCGVPTIASGACFQTKVANVFVATNQSGIPKGAFPEGNIEFWPDNYANTPALRLPGAGTQYDWDDTRSNPQRGYGSMQIHLFAQKTTLFAYNHFSQQGTADFGLGNNAAGQPDWTLMKNLAKDWKSASLKVFVRME